MCFSVLQIKPGAEGALACAGDDGNAQIAVGLKQIERLAQFGADARMECVEHLGAVEGKDGDAAFKLSGQILIGLAHDFIFMVRWDNPSIALLM